MEEGNNKNILLSNKFIWVLLAILLVGTYLVSGYYGLRVVIILLAFTLPFYLIINSLNFSTMESFVYGAFFSLAFLSLLVFWVTLIVGSYRLALVISYLVLLSIGMIYFFIKRRKR